MDGMPKAKAKRRVRRKEVQAVELQPDAWPRFERFIRNVAKSSPPKSAKPPAK
jgi:hypothetical protein